MIRRNLDNIKKIPSKQCNWTVFIYYCQQIEINSDNRKIKKEIQAEKEETRVFYFKAVSLTGK